eukprot:6199240-Pleurochrysis_carterae.AAC.1
MDDPYNLVDPVRRLLSGTEVQCRRAFFHVSRRSLCDMTHRILSTDNAEIATRIVLTVSCSKLKQMQSLGFQTDNFQRELYVLFVNSTKDQHMYIETMIYCHVLLESMLLADPCLERRYFSPDGDEQIIHDFLDVPEWVMLRIQRIRESERNTAAVAQRRAAWRELLYEDAIRWEEVIEPHLPSIKATLLLRFMLKEANFTYAPDLFTSTNPLQELRAAY